MYRERDFMARNDGADDDYIRRMLSGGCSEGDSQGGVESESGKKAWGLRGYPLAMVYSPIQEWRELYDNDMALSRGTMFRELDLPFLGSWNDETPTCRGCGGVKNG